ncbi:hypothetical protein HT121_23105 [Pseudomonas sp. MAFF 301514]|uniref:Lipoprotein n=1 Tax=Pseudomonas allii TaxID=2740531 RepID=A0A7Y8UZS0_9PSED|nr:hypothetical protein [Pseudomonas allii]KTB61714.1 hypothetical protein AO066_25790 [Pseudomonas fluorescens]NWN50285.1 hypothetical protein [Pseudomonas allii]NWN63320.1 hypothetical protein [Pseudomonas allii]RMP89971.1 hypothetical protein ALQ17_03464 [Pseudomonas fluorescens]
MRITAMALVATSTLLLTACSESPSDTDIQAALQPRLEGASCISAPMFKDFPVTLGDSFTRSVSKGNAPAFDALVDAGLLAKSDQTYTLTEPGKAAHVPQASGFCYAQGYEIARVQSTEVNTDQMGPAVEKSWQVTVDIRQKPVAPWAKNPAIEQLTRHPETLSEAPKTYHVTVGRVKGEQGLQLIDPRFSISRGISVSQGF